MFEALLFQAHALAVLLSRC